MERITGFEAERLPTAPAREITLTPNMPYFVGSETSPQDAPKLADLPEFQGITNKDQLLAMQLLDSNAMVGLTFQQKRMFLIFYYWQNTYDTEDAERPLGIGASEKREIIHKMIDEWEVRFDRFSGLVDLVKPKSNRRIARSDLSEFDYWIHSKLKVNPDQADRLFREVPPELLPEKVELVEVHTLINKSIQRLKNYKLLPKRIPKERMHKKEVLKTRDEIVAEVLKRTGKQIVMKVIDMWVYTSWFSEGKTPQELSKIIPLELGFDHLSDKDKLKLITSRIHRLRNLSVLSSNFRKRNNKLRQRKILKRILESDMLLPISTLAEEFKVHPGIVSKDIKSLRDANLLPGSRIMSDEAKQRFGFLIKRTVEELEKSGRSYEEGDISPGEIARNLRMNNLFVVNFIRRNRSLVGLPERKDPMRGKLHARIKAKSQVLDVINETGELSPSRLHKLITTKHPDFSYTMSFVRKLRNELISEEVILNPQNESTINY